MYETADYEATIIPSEQMPKEAWRQRPILRARKSAAGQLKYISKSYGPFGSCDVRRHSYGANHQRKYSSPSKPKFHPAFAALIDTSLVISSMILLSISSTASRIASNSPKRRTTSPNSTWLLCVIPNPRSSKSVRGGCCCVTDTSQERLRTPTRSPAPGYSGFNFNGYYRCAALIGIG